MKNIYIKISIVSFLLGVFVCSNTRISYLEGVILLMWIVFVLMITKFKRKYFLIILISAIFLISGYLRFYFSVPEINTLSVHFYQNEDVKHKLRGLISENPDKRKDKVNYFVSVDQIYLNEKWLNVTGKILVSADLYPEFFYGDFIEIYGFLIPPAEFEGFSYKNYLSLYNVYSVIYSPSIKRISGGGGSPFFAGLFLVKDIFEERINELFPEPMASFTAGLLTGSRKGIPDDLMKSFNITGLTHIIAISGYNISLIIFFVSSFLSKSSRKLKVPVIIGFVVLFTLFVGASPAVVRASIMGIVAVLALSLGRQSLVLNALLISAFIMVLLNPNVLLYDVGFQLSFLATLGLIITGERIKKIFSFLPDCMGIREGIAMTLSAQIFALPIILLNFERLSIISPLANLLIVPFIPFAMLFGFAAVILSCINFSLGFLFTFPAWLALKWIVEIVGVLSKLPYSSMETPWFGVYHFGGYYLLIILFAYLVNHNFGNRFLRIGRFNMNGRPVRDIKSV